MATTEELYRATVDLRALAAGMEQADQDVKDSIAACDPADPQTFDGGRTHLSTTLAQIVGDIEAAETAATGAIAQLSSESLTEIQQQQTTSVAAVSAQQTTSVAAVTTQQTASVAAVAAQGAESTQNLADEEQAISGRLTTQETAAIAAVSAQQTTSVAAVVTQQGLSVQAVVDQEANAAQNLADQEQEISGGLTAREQATIEAAEDAVTVLRGVNGAQLNVGAPIGKSVETLHGEALTAAADAETAKAGAEAARDSAVEIARAQSPFTAGATNANPQLVSDYLASILDVQITGAPQPAHDYYVERVRRNHYTNATGPYLYYWFIRICRASDGATAYQYLVSGADSAATSPEPDDPSTPVTITLASQVGDGATATLLVRWSGMTENAEYTGSAGMTLRDTCWRDEGEAGEEFDAPLTRLAARDQITAAQTSATNAGTAAAQAQTTATNAQTTVGAISHQIIPEAGPMLVAGQKVSWGQLYVTDALAPVSSRHRIAAGSVTFTADYQVAWIELSECRASSVTLPDTAIKVSLPVAAGGTYVPSPARLVLAQRIGGRVSLSPLALAMIPSVGPWEQQAVALKKTGDSVSVYYRHAGKRLYIEEVFARYVSPGAVADVWCFQGAYEAERTAIDAWTRGQMILRDASEQLCAMREKGAQDFSGGKNHGYVTTLDKAFLVDGKRISADGTYFGSQVEVRAENVMYRDGTGFANKVALHDQGSWLAWRGGKRNLSAWIEHKAAVTLDAGYMAMMPLLRYAVSDHTAGTEDTSSALISGLFEHNLNMQTIDASAYSAAGIDWQAGITRWRATSPYGTGGEMRVLSATGPLADFGGLQLSHRDYNKAYVGFKDDVTVAIGERWEIEVEMILWTSQ